MAISKAEKKALRLEQKEKRRAAEGEIMSARLRFGIGFAGAYIATGVLPALFPTLAEHATTIDLGLAGAGGYLALTDPGEAGDFAMGVGAVGTTQTLDKVIEKLSEWFAK